MLRVSAPAAGSVTIRRFAYKIYRVAHSIQINKLEFRYRYMTFIISDMKNDVHPAVYPQPAASKSWVCNSLGCFVTLCGAIPMYGECFFRAFVSRFVIPPTSGRPLWTHESLRP
jgi:hypothetical protein